MATISLDPTEPSTTGSEQIADVGLLVVRPAHIFAIPATQRYYWTEDWQAGESETLQALKNGEGIRFPNGKAFSEWLLNEDDNPTNGD